MTLSYELAKELKDAGFPFIRIEGGMCVGRQEVFDFNPEGSEELGAQHFFAPTLSELMEACGDGFLHLRHIPRNSIDERWAVSGTPLYACVGSSAEEVVMRLWLELNKK